MCIRHTGTRAASGAASAEAAFDLPPELRNRITRFALEGARSAGIVSLTDDSLKRRKIALIRMGPEQETLQLLSPLHYLRQGLSPSADIIEGNLIDTLKANPDVVILADVADVTEAELEALNPQHPKPLLVASAGQGVVLPEDKAARFEQALLAHRGPLASWTARRVARTTTVEALARLFGSDVATLRSVNRIASGHLVVAGSTVLIPRVSKWDDVAEAKLHAAVLRTAPAYTALRVKASKGWGWTEVAREVNRRAGPVTAVELKRANQKVKLKAGWLRLLVPAPEARVRLVGHSRGASITGVEHV